MQKMIRRVAAALLCAAMLLTVVPFSVASVTAASNDAPVMAFVPLDNRPVCVDRTRLAAQAAGFAIELPPEDYYKTLLDGQGGNIQPYGCQVGDGAAIMTWLEGMEAAGCDYYVIHLDQMFSGGLVGSRYPDSNAITDAEANIMDRLIALSNIDGNHIYFVDTVMRLASTGSFKGYVQGEYGSFREYAIQTRWELETKGFYTADYNESVGQLDRILANYQVGAAGQKLGYYGDSADEVTTEWMAKLDQSMIDTYHGSRRRKMDLINLMMQFGNRNATYFIGVDDASPSFTIQGNELNFIRARMETLGYTYYLSADTDSSGLMAIARCVNDYYGSTPRIRVRYYGDMADAAADDYDIGTLRSNVQTHVECLNATYIDEKTNAGSSADIELLVLTKISANHTIGANGASSAYVNNIQSLVQKAKANIAANVPTIIIDASTEANYFKSWVKGYTNLQDELIANVELSKLLGYSNWNTVGNTIGIALGTGVARYSYLKCEPSPSVKADYAFVQSLTYSYVKDIAYNARNKNQDYTWTFQYWINRKAGSEGDGWNSSNFYTEMHCWWDGDWWNEHGDSSFSGDAGEYYVNYHLEQCILHNTEAKYDNCANKILQNIANGEFYTSLNGAAKTAGIEAVSLSNFRLPWYRQFEMSFDVAVTLDAPAVEYYEVTATLLKAVPAKQTQSTMVACVKEQFGASFVTVKNLGGNVIGASDYVGTGFSVTMTVNGAEKTYQTVIYGETDGDGRISTTDVRRVIQSVLGVYSFSEAQTEAADFNHDNTVTSTDARQILMTALEQS
ncbi:MAG: DUF4127 family protein [Clostridia bacterium]|nr:DUF4127 family protein [Clostridia bacterium]